MLFKETLTNLTLEVEVALDELFQAAKSNQTHEQDLLLVEINGFYDKKLDSKKSNLNLSPFGFGPGGWLYFTNYTQYRFYDIYRREISELPRLEYFTDFKIDQRKQAVYDFTLQLELMVYLKFWESDVILRKLYQLSNLAQGKNYDWYFSITKDDTRHKLIRELIRDPIKDICPKFYKLLKDIYLSQIRNAAAHSQFYIEQGKLGFNNYDPSDHAPLSQITFQEWEDRFHKLVLMYNSLIRCSQKSHAEYIAEQTDKHYGLQVRITKNDGSIKKDWIKYVDSGGRIDWMWYKIWDSHYRDSV
jgi:hypothetical protein